MLTLIIVLMFLICTPILFLIAGALALPFMGIFLALTVIFSIIAIIFKLIFAGPLVILALIFGVYYFSKKKRRF